MDAGREIEGYIYADDSQMGLEALTPDQGCFQGGERVDFFDLSGGIRYGHYGGGKMTFKASRSWGVEHTADEFRPMNTAVLYCIKHD